MGLCWYVWTNSSRSNTFAYQDCILRKQGRINIEFYKLETAQIKLSGN